MMITRRCLLLSLMVWKADAKTDFWKVRKRLWDRGFEGVQAAKNWRICWQIRKIRMRGHKNEGFRCGILQKQSKTKEKDLHSCKSLWSWWPDSNRWPHPYQGCALPTELHQRIVWREIYYTITRVKMQGFREIFFRKFYFSLPSSRYFAGMRRRTFSRGRPRT